jgi:hypothetical protein
MGRPVQKYVNAADISIYTTEIPHLSMLSLIGKVSLRTCQSRWYMRVCPKGYGFVKYRLCWIGQ